MLPPAPPRLSTTTCCPHVSNILWASRREMMSVAAPGANGTMIRIGRDGYAVSAACRASGSTSAASPESSLFVVNLMASSGSSAGRRRPSLGRDVGVLDDPGVTRRLGRDELRELFRRAASPHFVICELRFTQPESPPPSPP